MRSTWFISGSLPASNHAAVFEWRSAVHRREPEQGRSRSWSNRLQSGGRSNRVAPDTAPQFQLDPSESECRSRQGSRRASGCAAAAPDKLACSWSAISSRPSLTVNNTTRTSTRGTRFTRRVFTVGRCDPPSVTAPFAAGQRVDSGVMLRFSLSVIASVDMPSGWIATAPCAARSPAEQRQLPLRSRASRVRFIDSLVRGRSDARHDAECKKSGDHRRSAGRNKRKLSPVSGKTRNVPPKSEAPEYRSGWQSPAPARSRKPSRGAQCRGNTSADHDARQRKHGHRPYQAPLGGDPHQNEVGMHLGHASGQCRAALCRRRLRPPNRSLTGQTENLARSDRARARASRRRGHAL